MTASHLAFYTAHRISPVRQDISDLSRHFERRAALYRHLGILPGFLRGRRVLEVGPGGGFNALYTASLGPGRFTLIEGNPTGVEHMRSLFSDFPQWTENIEILLSRIEEYCPSEGFDFVFCEGLLSGVPNPEEVLKSLGDATAPGGVLIITCVDHLSHFPETLRRMFAQLVVSRDDDLDTKVEKILPMMEPHLATLIGMSRRRDDWVIDNLIHPGSIIPLINIPEAVVILANEFEFYAASPHFVTDWRWYKSIVGDEWGFNHAAIEQYWMNVHSFLDYRRRLPPRAVTANQALYDRCTGARRQVELFEKTGDREFVRRFRSELAAIIADVRSFSEDIAAALEEAARLLDADRLDREAVANAKRFGALFGRGQQYISLTKRS